MKLALQTPILVALLAWNLVHAQALDKNARALDLIVDAAVKLCGTVKDSGSAKGVELSVGAKAELGGLLKQLTSLGVDVRGKYVDGQFSGVQQKDLAAAMKDNAKCRVDVLKELKSTLLSAAEERPPTLCFPQLAGVHDPDGSIADSVKRLPEYVSSALLLVASTGDLQCIRSLLKAGARPNGPIEPSQGGVRGRTPLFAALESDSPETVKELLRGGANPNLRSLVGSTVDPIGMPPIVEAAARSAPLAALLLEAGADVNAIGRGGKTALHWAALRDDSALVKSLVNAGARRDVRDTEHRKTPLELALANGANAAAALLSGQ